MARGWESKSVADQIEEGKSVRARQDSVLERTPAELRKQERRRALSMSRARLLEQLERARIPAHRSLLLSGLAAIEKQLEDLETDR